MPAAAPQSIPGKGVRRDALFLLLLTALSLMLFTRPLFDGSLEAGFPLDDGWIHAVYARNLAGHGEFAFNPGEPSTGTTSLLWTVLLAAALTTGGNPVTSALLLAAVCLLVLVAVWHRLLLRTGAGRMAALAGAALLPLSGILQWWTLSGMETALFLMLAALALEACSRDRFAWSGSWLALLVLARPEGILLAPVIAVFAWRRRGTPRAALLVTGLAAAGLAVYVGWNLAVSGAPWTSTMAGRRWLAAGGHPAAPGISAFLTAFPDILLRWTRLLLWGAVRWSPTGIRILAAAAGVSLVWVTGAEVLRRRRLNPQSRGRRAGAPGTSPAAQPTEGRSTEAPGIPSVLGTWLLLHTAAYAALLPYPGHAGRYLAPLLLGVSLLLAHILSSSRAASPDGGGTPVADLRRAALPLLLKDVLPRAVLLAAAVLVGWSALSTWSATWHSSVGHINSVHRRAAEWIAAHTTPDARIAAYDIGAIGYFSDRQVIDLGGLVQPAVVPYMNGRIDAYILTAGAGYVAMVAPYEGLQAEGYLPNALGYGMSGLLLRRRLEEFSIPEARYRRHISVTGNAYPRMLIEKAQKKPEKS